MAVADHVTVRGGDLCARRPGSERTRKPVRLPAERLRRGAFLFSRHAGRRFIRRGLGADVFSRAQGFGGRQATARHRSPIFFFGLGRAPACEATAQRPDQSSP